MPKTKKSIVFCHGLWADGSCFSKLIVPLLAEGYECIAAQYGLNTTTEDVTLTKATIGRVSNPVILVGHSYVPAAKWMIRLASSTGNGTP